MECQDNIDENQSLDWLIKQYLFHNWMERRSNLKQTKQANGSKTFNNEHFLTKKYSPQRQQDINQTESDLIPQKFLTAQRLPQDTIEKDYEPANYNRAIQYKILRSYFIKSEGQQYRQIQLFEETNRLKYFGLGPYFYIEFMRRICWIFLVLSLFEGIRIYINSRSSGLSNYSASFSTYLIATTLGNYNSNSLSNVDPYIVAIVPAVGLLVLTFFYLCWKCHFYGQIDQEQNNNENIKPQKFCVEVQALSSQIQLDELKLKEAFSYFGPIHEISLIKRHKNKLQYFQQLENLEEAIRQIELQLRFQQTENQKQKIDKLRQQKQRLLNELKSVKINPKTISAYIHFEYQKSKIQCLAYFNDRFLFDYCSHSCCRCCCCCCIDKVDDRFKINSENLLIKEAEVPSPEDINWQSFQISPCSKFCRLIFAILIIIIFLTISCAIIGACTIYISTHSSNCQSVVVPSNLIAAQLSTDPLVKKCYCNANLIASLKDSAIESYCSSQLKGIYLEQGIQYIIIITSIVTNFLFSLVLDKIIDCTRPKSQSHNLKIKTLIYTIFLIINTIVLPILLCSDIFGFKTSSYFSFLTVISSDLSSLLSIQNIQLYLDYNQIWYRNVSPIFTNFLIFDIVGVWIMFLLQKFKASKDSLSEKQNKILQKRMNNEISSYQFSPYKEYSSFLMIIFLTLLLNGGIPVLFPLATINLASRYTANRSLIQHSSTRVDGLGVVFNELPHHLMPFLIIIGSINGCWMLTANSKIYPNQLPFGLNIQSGVTVLDRELYLPFYVVLAILVFSQYFVYNFLIRFCSFICSCCFEKKMVAIPRYTKTFSEHKKTLNILTSYNIKNNDKMRNAVTRMELYLQK